MKKRYVPLFSAAMLVAMATAATASAIETSGEANLDYFSHHWTGENLKYTSLGMQLNNHLPVSGGVSGNVNFWMDTDTRTDTYHVKVDAAYAKIKLGQNSLKIGCDDFRLEDSLNVLGDFTKNILGGSLKEAPIQVLATVPLGEKFMIQSGYFYRTGGKHTSHSWDKDSLLGEGGRNNWVVKGSYSAGKISANAAYLVLGKAYWDSVAPAGEYVINAGYKITDKTKVYAAYIGAAQVVDGNKDWEPKASEDQIDNFAIVGFQTTLGKLWLAAEYTVLTPEKDHNDEWIKYTDNTYHEHNWAENRPFGFTVSYWLGHTITLQYTRVTNTGVSSDKDRLRLQMKF